MEQYALYLRKSRFDRDYAELSTEETLKRHKAILDKVASERGYYVSQIFYEVVSGESIASRPEIQKLLEEVGAGIYTGVLVVDVERLARGNNADQAYISQIFQFSGTKIITPTKTYDPSNEYDEEYFEFGLFMSRREYKTINRRLIRGRDSSASEGKYIGSIAPYGYRRVKLEKEKGYILEPETEEAENVKKIFEMFLQNKGTRIIANYLNDMDVPTRHGDLWSPASISNIVSNPVYMGKIRRGWSKQVKSIEDGVVKKKIKRQNEYGSYPVFDGLHQPLITEEQFLLAQEIRQKKAPKPKTKDETDLKNPFAGLLYCSCCGKRVGRHVMSKKRDSRQRVKCINMRNCKNRSADFDVVEKAIITSLNTWYEGYKVKIDTIGYQDDIEDCRKQLKKVELEISKINTQLDSAFNLVEQGVYTLEIFQQRRHKLNDSLEVLQEKKQNIELLLQGYEESEASKNNLIPQTEELLASYNDMSIRERNDLLKAILEKIQYFKGSDGKIEIDLFPRLPKL